MTNTELNDELKDIYLNSRGIEMFRKDTKELMRKVIDSLGIDVVITDVEEMLK